MPDATLNAGVLIDDLVPVVDDIRSIVHGTLGTRAYRVYVVHRTWSGERPGEGDPIETATEIAPAPKVLVRGLHAELRPAGLEEEGDVVLSEISLTWTESELYAAKDASNESAEFFYRIDDGHGQGARSRYYVPVRPPVADRDGSVSWLVELRRISNPGGPL